MVTIACTDGVLRMMQDHAVDGLHVQEGGGQSDATREVKGFLLGTVTTSEGGRFRVTIRDVVPLPYRPEDAGDHATVDARDHAYLDSQRRDGAARLDVVGFYHSHPNHGIFLSQFDVSFLDRMFPEPWHVAVVVQPRDRQAGFFVRGNDQLRSHTPPTMLVPTAPGEEKAPPPIHARPAPSRPPFPHGSGGTVAGRYPSVPQVRTPTTTFFKIGPLLVGLVVFGLVVGGALATIVTWYLVSGSSETKEGGGQDEKMVEDVKKENSDVNPPGSPIVVQQQGPTQQRDNPCPGTIPKDGLLLKVSGNADAVFRLKEHQQCGVSGKTYTFKFENMEKLERAFNVVPSTATALRNKATIDIPEYRKLIDYVREIQNTLGDKQESIVPNLQKSGVSRAKGAPLANTVVRKVSDCLSTLAASPEETGRARDYLDDLCKEINDYNEKQEGKDITLGPCQGASLK